MSERRIRGVLGGSLLVTVDLPKDLATYLTPKGSVAVDGISLTLVDVEADRFSVALIPHTLNVTTLGQLKEGDPVNIETDVLAKYVARQLGNNTDTKKGIDIELLTKSGFMR